MRDIYRKLFETYKSYIRKGNFRATEKILDKIEEVNPAKGWYHHSLLFPALSSKGAKIYPKQIEYLKKSPSYDSKDPSTWRALGNVYFQLKKYDLAENAYKQSLKYSRSELYKNDALRFLADISIANGELDGALKMLNKVLRSKHRPPYIQLAGHFIDYYKAKGNQETVDYWAKKGVTSTKIIEKSGKQPYGTKDIYQKRIKHFESFIK